MAVKKSSRDKRPVNPYLNAASPDELGPSDRIAYDIVADRLVFVYGMLAGSLPDFWIGLLLILVFFYALQWAPPPVGQLDFAVSAPDYVTGAYVVDALVTGNWPALWSALANIVLPLATLVLVYMPLVLKTARSAMETAWSPMRCRSLFTLSTVMMKRRSAATGWCSASIFSAWSSMRFS